MYNIEEMCCLCLNSIEVYNNLSNFDCDKVSYYEKINLFLAKLNFKNKYKDFLLCLECSDTIDIVYEFSKRCIEKFNTYLKYQALLSSQNDQPSELVILISDDKKIETNVKKCIKLEKTDYETDYIVHRNSPEPEDSDILNCDDLTDDNGTNDIVNITDVILDDINENKISQIQKEAFEIIAEDIEIKIEDLGIKIEEPDAISKYLNEDRISHEEINTTEIKSDENQLVAPRRRCNGHIENLNISEQASHDIDINLAGTNEVNQYKHYTNVDNGNNKIIQSHKDEDYSSKHTLEKLHLYICKICNEVFTHLDNFIEHKSTHVREKYNCDVCNMEFINARQLTKHKLTHFTPKPYVCRKCDKKFTRLDSFKIHKQLHIKKKYTCDVCAKEFVKLSLFTRHKLIHTNKKLYFCNICNQGYKQLSSLIRHKLTHPGEKPYVCKICNKGFRKPTEFHKHQRDHKKEMLKCDVCKKLFTKLSVLVKHQRVHTGDRPYECTICHMRFGQQNNLTRHQISHTNKKPYKCDICKKGFTNAYSVMIHKRSHTKEKPYECDICHRRFVESYVLKSHKLTHTGQKSYECDICKVKVSTRGNLTRHKRTHIDKKYPYDCKICKRSFATKDHLATHNRKHTGERPYKCDMCIMKFISSSNLQKHKRTHTNPKTHECDICKKKFRRLHRLTAHKLTHD